MLSVFTFPILESHCLHAVFGDDVQRVGVIEMSLMHVTKDGFCAYCGAKQQLCEVCKGFFHAKNVRHVICSDKCQTKKGRDKKRVLEIE